MIETDRLIIDTIKESDKEDYFFNISHDKKVLETFICNYAESIDSFDFTRYLGNDSIFAIRLKNSKKLIGILTLFKEKEDSIEIGYGIGSAYWNKGYTSEAVRPFIQYLFNNYNITYVLASYFSGNDASRRVMEKCGMKYSHEVKNELEYLGKSRDLTYFRISKNDIY